MVRGPQARMNGGLTAPNCFGHTATKPLAMVVGESIWGISNKMKNDTQLDFRKISPDDYDEVVDAMACAFMDDPLLNLVAPRDRDRMEILRIMEHEMLR